MMNLKIKVGSTQIMAPVNKSLNAAPNPATGGYTHMGDCMAFLAVLYLGKKDGALAAVNKGILNNVYAKH